MRLSFLKYETVNFILDDFEVIGLAECRLGSKFSGKIPVKIIYSQGGKTGINYFIKGSIQSRSPVPDSGGLSSSGASGQEAEAFCGKQVVQTELKCYNKVVTEVANKI